MLQQLVKDFMAHPIADSDIMNICNGQTRIIKNSSLRNYKTLEELLKPYGSCVILYDKSDGSAGHWSCLTQSTHGVEFFCPYGYYPDKALQTINGKPYITRLIQESKQEVSYNDFKLQKLSKDVNVCGRYVGMRVLLKELPLKSFIGLFSSKGYTSDFWVTIMTLFCEN